MADLRSHLRRYWFTWDELPQGNRARGLGCGVTAESRHAAEMLLSAAIFDRGAVPPPSQFVEDVDVSTLDAGHVLPNMGDPVVRGVWFPQGFAKPS